MLIWIGLHEGDAINLALAGLEVPRPQTQDLLKSIVEVFEGRTERVVVTDFRDDTLFAEITISDGDETRAVDARPDDAIALAVRCDAPIYVAEAVLERAATSVDRVTGVIEVNGTAAGTLLPAGEDAESIRVGEHLMRRLRLNSGDEVTGRVAPRSAKADAPILALIDSVNGEPPRAYRTTDDPRLPLVLPTPNDWYEDVPPRGLERYGMVFLPFATPRGALAITARASEVGDASAREVIERAVSESEGAYEFVQDDGSFALPDGFEATALTRTIREIRNNALPGRLLEFWYSLEGVTTRWVVAVRGGRAIIVVLEALDWQQGAELEPLLSRCELVDGVDLSGLTEREIHVLTHLVGGATNPEIAERLEISPHTVAKHVKSILAKLEAANRTEAASTAVSRGIVDSSSNN